MAARVWHSFTSPKVDGPDDTLVKPSDWNADHVIDLPNLEDLPTAEGDTTYVASPNGTGGLVFRPESGGDHDHDGSPTQKLAQANTHESPDTDVGPTSLHHTIGAGAAQAAAGDHSHGASGLTTGQVGARVALGV